jgi:hypothetical protein
MASSMNQNGVFNIILDSNEVGSGIEQVAAGRYFSPLTASGKWRTNNEKIIGLGIENIITKNIPIRTDRGKIRNDQTLKKELETEIENSIEAGLRPIVHILHRSKTGLISPSIESCHKLIQQYHDDVEWVVDACQGRISIRTVNEYLAFGASVMITGSKFFSGPPFSGAILVPKSIREQRLSSMKISNGMSDFFTQYEFPETWESVVKVLPDKVNLGLLLR